MKKLSRWFWVGFVVVYWVSRLVFLTKLPVFADEAIYIRWAQMMTHDPKQFTFLPMFDGKTPLFMWLLVPFLPLSPLDPLWVARCLSSLFGFAIIWFLVQSVARLGGNDFSRKVVALLFLASPFTLFHSRMGLIDTLLVFFLSVVFYSLIRLRQTPSILWSVIAGSAWGLSLWTKVPALFMGPIFGMVFLFLPPRFKTVRQGITTALLFGFSGLIGLGLFYSLRISPLFPFLFQRSQDFTFTIAQVLEGEWKSSLTNFRRFGVWSAWYLTLPVILAPLLVVPFSIDKKRPYFLPLVLFLMGVVFCGPFLVLGKVLSPRYLLPMVVFMLPASSLAFEYIWKQGVKKVCLMSAGLFLVHASFFAAPLYFNPGLTPFVPDDTSQYLTEWSAGYGIPEVRDFITTEAQDSKVVVATEGYFGTLPDGLLMYFDRSPLIKEGKLEIFGVGQPIVSLNPKITAQAQDTQVYLLVNAHRMKLPPDTCCELVGSYKRPLNGPPLLLYKVHSRQTQ